MTEPLVDLHLSIDQLSAIGLVAARWSFLETEITFTTAALGSLVEDDQRLPIPFKRILQRWRKLARSYLREGEPFRYYEKLIDAALEAHLSRSKLLHGRMYGDSTGTSTDVYVDEHRHLEEWITTPRDFSMTWLSEHAEAVRDLTIRVIAFNRNHLRISPYTLPRTRR